RNESPNHDQGSNALSYLLPCASSQEVRLSVLYQRFRESAREWCLRRDATYGQRARSNRSDGWLQDRRRYHHGSTHRKAPDRANAGLPEIWRCRRTPDDDRHCRAGTCSPVVATALLQLDIDSSDGLNLSDTQP